MATHGDPGLHEALTDGTLALPSTIMYYEPETRAYHISGSTKLFPQHCQLPTLTPHQHLRALTEELAAEGSIAGMTTKGRRLLTLL